MSIFQLYKENLRLLFLDNRDGLCRSRRAVFLRAVCLSMVNTAVKGVFYTTLLILLLDGANPTLENNAMALFSGISSFFTLFQLLSPFLFERLKRKMPLIFLLTLLSEVAQVVILPLAVMLPLPIEGKIGLFVGAVAFSTASSALTSPALSGVQIFSLPNFCRSEYFSTVSVAQAILSLIPSLLLSVFMDYFKAHDQALVGVLIARGVGLIFAAAELYFLRQYREPEMESPADSSPRGNSMSFGDFLKAPFQSGFFLVAILIHSLNLMSDSFIGSFYSAYLLDDVSLSYTVLSIFGVISVPCSMLTMPFWNKLIRKIGWHKGMMISASLFSLCYLLNLFVTPQTKVIYFISCLCSQLFSGGEALYSANLMYMYLPQKNKTGCIAFYNVIGALVSTGASFLGGLFMNATQGFELHLFGLSIENRAYGCAVAYLFHMLPVLIAFFLLKGEKKRGISSVPSR